MKFINESIYWHGTARISDCLNRLLQGVLDCTDMLSLDILVRKQSGYSHGPGTLSIQSRLSPNASTVNCTTHIGFWFDFTVVYEWAGLCEYIIQSSFQTEKFSSSSPSFQAGDGATISEYGNMINGIPVHAI
jgi:hypothetical protein